MISFRSSLLVACLWLGGMAALSQEESPETAPEPDAKDLDTVVRVQIFLDEHDFGPGHIDGKMGEFTRKAAQNFNRQHSIDPANWYYILKASSKLVTTTYGTYRLKQNDFRFVVPTLPVKPDEQATYRYMGYRSIAEFVAERYHTSEECLQRINPGVNIDSKKAGDFVIVPNVKTPFLIESVAYQQKFAADPALSAQKVVVDTTARQATFLDKDGKLLASFPITPGQQRFIHKGEWQVKMMLTTPDFRWDKAMLEEGKYSDVAFELPPGPNSPVGIFWAGTSKRGIGLHGTATPHTIGRSESHGCIRFANWDAVRLPWLIRPGSKVVVR